MYGKCWINTNCYYQIVSITTVTITITLLFSLREFAACEEPQQNFSPPARREQLFGALLSSKRERKKLAMSCVSSKHGSMKQW